MRVLLAIASAASLLCPTSLMAGQNSGKPHVKLICPMLRAKVLKVVRPVYPKEAEEKGIEAEVSLRCIVGKDGSVESIEILRGKEPFVQAAKTAVAQWKYKPLLLNGVTVEVEETISIIFECP